MTSSTSRQLIESWMAAMTTHGIREGFERYAAPDYRQHNPDAQDGREGAIAYLEAEMARGSGVTVKRVMSEGDFVVLHLHMTFTDGSPDQSIVDVFRVENDKIVEHWDVHRDIPEICTNPPF